MCVNNSNAESSALSEKIKNYKKMFFNENVEKFSFYEMQNHVIKLNDNDSSYELLYNLLTLKLKAFWEYLDNALTKRWIKHFINSAEVLILFVSKKNESFYLCVDYCVFNKVIIKNKHVLSLINETLNYMMRVQIFSKIDLKDVYHCLCIKEDHKWKMIFCI